MTFERLEKEIGYTFRDKALLKTAFVHSTYANAHGGEDNERLEFLGDSVLQLVVSEMLYFREKKGKTLSEGEMTALRQALVRKEALLEAAEKLSLKNFLLVEGGEAVYSRTSRRKQRGELQGRITGISAKEGLAHALLFPAKRGKGQRPDVCLSRGSGRQKRVGAGKEQDRRRAGSGEKSFGGFVRKRKSCLKYREL